MLEHEILVFTPSGTGLGWTIHDAASGKPVGVARRLNGGGFWSRLLRRTCLAVHESEDEPLLCTVHRLWGFREAWELRDADAQQVGKLSRTVIRGRLGRMLSRVDAPECETVHYVDRRGRTTATLTRRGDCRLTFTPESKGDPFTRMLVLSGVLIEISRGSRNGG
jgi:hypothetical protein